MVEFFPAAKQPMIRSILAGVLRGVVCQRLLPRKGGGRIAAVEVMVANDRIAELIREARVRGDPDGDRRGLVLRDADAHAGADRARRSPASSTARLAAGAAPNRHDFLIALAQAEKTRGGPGRRRRRRPTRIARSRKEPHSDDRGTASASALRGGMTCGALFAAVGVRSRARGRELPERRRGAGARAALDRSTALGLRAAAARDRVVRQHPARLVPLLRGRCRSCGTRIGSATRRSS